MLMLKPACLETPAVPIILVWSNCAGLKAPLLQLMQQAQATRALVVTLTPWPLTDSEAFLDQVSDLLDEAKALGIELLDWLCIQGLDCHSLKQETDLWYAVDA